MDSVGGIIECLVDGMPAGVGETVFDKLDANLAKAVMSIGAIKGIEFGDGFKVTELTGSTDNDGFKIENDTIEKNFKPCRWYSWWYERWFTNCFTRSS